MKMEEHYPGGPEDGERSEAGHGNLHIVQRGTKNELLAGMAPRPIKQEPEEGLQQCQEAQWQEFLKTMQAPCLGWRPPQLPLPHSGEGLKEFWAFSFKEASLWPKGERRTPTFPGLRKEAPEAYENSLDPPSKLKEEILEWDPIDSEIWRQRFRRFCYWEVEGPRKVCRQLQGLCRQWLKPERHSKERILELVTLEQFLGVLPQEMQSWVRERCPQTCTQAAALAEDFLLGLQGSERSEKQLPEALEGVVVNTLDAEHDPSDVVKMQLAMEAKEESDGEAISFMADGQDSEARQKNMQWKPFEQVEFDGASLGRAEGNVFLLPELGEVCGTPQQPQRHIGSDPRMKMKEASSLGESHEDFNKNASQEGMYQHKIKEADIDSVVNFSRSSVALTNQILEAADKPYKCSDCGRGFHQKPYLRVHERIHTGEKPYKCLDCGKSFNRRTGLCSHQRVHMGEKPYRCSYCGKCFTGTGSLKEHERTHTGEKPHKCLYCGKSFNRRGVLCKHKRLHTGEKPYRCSYCGKNFSQRSHLISHERTHTGEKPYECTDCGKSFRQSNDLSRHQKIHKGEKLHKCAECGEAFYQRAYLIRHERTHMGEKPYECSDCGKSFYQQAHLNAHKKIHTEEKPYHCFECGKSFRQSSDLHRHQSIHNGEKPHKCLECGEGFFQRAYLVRHERTHTGKKPYECSACGKSFYLQADLNAHQKIHMEEKPYHCFECGKSFHQSSDLHRHQSIHNGEKQHQCPECGKNFYHRVYLMRHVRTHT
ncbi:zinc finger protein 436-like [Rhineura floridana]|uniref:zinc finger protein 436-like n=1 Tax=Rhineura floridana TaxID=261503 RepID=UPI002AC84BFE|nr:zinc finger protein 436-like [Rhineura floridana]XP_061475769.1 zinc finger protein 436-like [Rhineura floridana]